MWWLVLVIVAIFCLIVFMILFDEAREYDAFEKDFGFENRKQLDVVDKRDLSLRLNYLWKRKLMIDDQRNAIFEEACAIYGVDPDMCCRERDFVQECFLDVNTGMTPGITQIRLDEYRYDRERERQEN